MSIPKVIICMGSRITSIESDKLIFLGLTRSQDFWEEDTDLYLNKLSAVSNEKAENSLVGKTLQCMVEHNSLYACGCHFLILCSVTS